jgi:hypothetical protein
MGKIRGKVVGGWHWLLLIAQERRCYICQRLYLVHFIAPWRLYRCNRTPMPIEITERGWAYLRGDEEGVA